MLKSTCLFLCFCSVIIGSYAGLAFIDKCEWNNKDCLKKSSQKALPYFAAGLPEFEVHPLDPLAIGNVKIDEGGLVILFKDMTVVGASKAKVLNVERNLDKSYLLFEVELPIHVHGSHITSGNFLNIPIEGDGPFDVKSEKVFISVKAEIVYVDGADGQKHWKVGKVEHTFDFKEKAFIKLENLFNGDKEKAEPINQLLDHSWKDLIQTLGKDIMGKAINKTMEGLQKLIEKVPASELEA